MYTWGFQIGKINIFLINNAVEALILLKEDYQLLLTLCVHLGESSDVDKNVEAFREEILAENFCRKEKEFSIKLKSVIPEGFSEFIKIVFILGGGIVGEFHCK